MRTYPMWRENKTLHAFEIPNSFVTVRGLRKLLRSIPDVTNVSLCGPFGENRIEFIYSGEHCVIWESFGDDSRFWIGSKTPESSSVDIKPLHDAFFAYQPSLGFIAAWILLVAGVTVTIVFNL